MTPGSRSKELCEPSQVGPDPADAEDLRAAVVESDEGGGRVIGPADLKHWAETGEWPEGSD